MTQQEKFRSYSIFEFLEEDFFDLLSSDCEVENRRHCWIGICFFGQRKQSGSVRSKLLRRAGWHKDKEKDD